MTRQLNFLLIRNRLMRCSFSVVNPVAVTTHLLRYFYISANKEYLTKMLIIFISVYSAFCQLYCVKLSFKLADISRSYGDVLGVHVLS